MVNYACPRCGRQFVAWFDFFKHVCHPAVPDDLACAGPCCDPSPFGDPEAF